MTRITHTGNLGTRARDEIRLYNLTDYDVDMVVVPATCVFGDPDYCNALGELRAAQAEATKDDRGGHQCLTRFPRPRPASSAS